MARYNKKPGTVDAIQYDGNNAPEIRNFVGKDRLFSFRGQIYIETDNGTVMVNDGDYVIRGLHDYYPCPPDTFRQLYEPARWSRP